MEINEEIILDNFICLRFSDFYLQGSSKTFDTKTRRESKVPQNLQAYQVLLQFFMSIRQKRQITVKTNGFSIFWAL